MSASAPPDTVLITLTVADGDAERAALLANTMSDEFATMVGQLEHSAGAEVTVQERAVPPGAPSSPTTVRNVALGVLGGVVLGAAVVLVRERVRGDAEPQRAADQVLAA